jgi:hypothetical protein
MNSKLNRLRRKHLGTRHPFDKSILIEKLTSEKHPHTDKHYVFTVNIRECGSCGLIFYDNGLESRKGVLERDPIKPS